MVSKGVVKSMKAIRYILERGFTNEVSKDIVKSGIAMELGTHQNTINSYMYLLEVLGILRKFTPNVYKIDLDKVQELIRLLKSEGIEDKDMLKVENLIKEHLVGGGSNAQ